MGSMSKYLMDELSRDIVAHDPDNWRKKVVWNFRVRLILFEDAQIYLAKVAFSNHFDGKSVALGVVKGAI